MERLTAFIVFLCVVAFLGVVGAVTSATMHYNNQQFTLAATCTEQQGTWVTPNQSRGMCLFGRSQ